MNKGILHTTIFTLLVILLFGCSTEKNTRVTRAYHNLTSKFNINFNARESLKAGEARIDQSIEDDFTHPLLIFKDSDPSSAQMVSSEMENVILKSSKLIKIHSITKKPKRRRSGGSRRYQEFARKEEFNNWIDDSYLLMGKAYFYQDNFLSAIENFLYVVRRFSEEETKYNAYVWLIRCYTEMERFVEASEVIQLLQGNDEFPKKLERELALVIADYNMKLKDYDETIKYLDIAIQKTFWKKPKARLKYILAQLYQETGKDFLASQAYAEVANLNPSYNMAFNARINAAGVFTGEGDAEKLKKELRKMLRDDKNIEFRDQIYFAIGNIHFKEGDKNRAIENYRRSVTSSITNSYQLAQSAITLADLYFEDLNYRNAQAYYDSTIIVIDENYPNYDNILIRYNSLTQLVENIFAVEKEDSLQKVALMDEAEREAFIDKLINEENERQKLMENAAAMGQGDAGFYRANQYRLGLGRTQMGAGWYFYNPQTVSFGKVQFQQRWGTRKLEDNWRRSDKTFSSEGEMDDLEESADSIIAEIRVEDPLQREFYTQDLPLTDSLMALSHDRIKDALYNAGKIFKTEFNNYERSIESYEELNRRYPDNIYTLSSYFDLYDLFELTGNKERSNYYRNLIIRDFPDSKYAKYLLNPNFFVDLEAQKDSLNRLYQFTFEKYKSGYYPQVISLTGQMKELEPDSIIMPKIDFLRSISLGTQSDLSNFESLLKGYINNYPKEETTILANDILSLIQDSSLSDYQQLVDIGYLNDMIQNEELLPGNSSEDEFGGKFSYDDDLLHYFVIAYPRTADIDKNRLKFDIANYNIDHYTKIDFDIETANLDGKTDLLIIRSLENKEKSLIYFRSIIRKSEVFKSLDNIDYINFVASSTNYREIIADKSLTDYLSFFVKNYSRFIKPEFQEDEMLERPEELMAKAEEEEDKLEEQGTFIMVTGDRPSGIFDLTIDTTQCFVLAIKDGAPIRPVLTQFSSFNKDEFRIWNLQLQLKKSSDYQLMVVKGIPGFGEGMSYFRRAVTNRDLFSSLENISYRNFLITELNLDRLTQNDQIDEYMNFFRKNYLQSNSAANTNTNQKQTTISPAQTDIEENTTNPETDEYSGPYINEIEKPHLFVFVIPMEDINNDIFKAGIAEFNQVNYLSQDLKIDEQQLDDFRNMIKISGLPDRNIAIQYFRQLVQDRSIFEPLGNASYRNFLITNKNFDVFLQEKNITEYMNFYKKVYLDN